MESRHVGPCRLQQGVLRRARQRQARGHFEDMREPHIVKARPAGFEQLIDDQPAQRVGVANHQAAGQSDRRGGPRQRFGIDHDRHAQARRLLENPQRQGRPVQRADDAEPGADDGALAQGCAAQKNLRHLHHGARARRRVDAWPQMFRGRIPP